MVKRQPIRVDSILADRVEAELAAELAAFEPDVPPGRIRDPGNKWLASSAWQKSIRRGETARRGAWWPGSFGSIPTTPGGACR